MPAAARTLHAKRIEACLDLISRALRGELPSRDYLVKELGRTYEERNIEPIRGWSKINIFEKELCTVYVVAKYGLGLDPHEYNDFYSRFLNLELKAERAAERMKAGEGVEAVEEEMGSADENSVFRVLRLEATAVLLGFKDEGGLATLLTKIEEGLPHLGPKVTGFKKFYIAFRVAQAIAAGIVSTRMEKEALKHALCIKFNASKAAPSDDFIREIAVRVLNLNERAVSTALALKHQTVAGKR